MPADEEREGPRVFIQGGLDFGCNQYYKSKIVDGMFRLKYFFKDGTHSFAPCGISLPFAVNLAQSLLRKHGVLEKIDIYEDDKLIASIYG